MKRLFGLLLVSILLVTAFATPAIALDDPLQQELDNTLTRTKLIPATSFNGDISYQELKFVFGSKGNIAVSCGDYSYQFELPFADADFTTYQNKSQVTREYTNGRDTVTYVFDFDRYSDRVNVDFKGKVSTDKLDINLQPITFTGNEFRVIGEKAWVGTFDDKGNPIGGIYFDWRDATQSSMVDKEAKRISFEVTPDRDFTIDPVVGTATTSGAAGFTYERKTFFASGRHWVFYSNGTNMVFRTSTDGISWSDATTVRAATYGHHFSICFDGTYFHYSYGSYEELTYRRGTPESDGTMTWSASEQTLVGDDAVYPCVAIDTSGYPYISYLDTSSNYGRILKSSTNDGTWSTAGGYPYNLHYDDTFSFSATILTLTNNRMYALYTPQDTHVLYGKLYDGSWGSEETIATINDKRTFSAVAYGDNVVVAYLKTSPYNIACKERTYGGSWSGESTIQASTNTDSSPTLSLTNISGDLICFWQGDPSSNYIYYKERESGTWDTDPTTWINETADTTPKYLTSYLQTYGSIIGLLYQTKSGSPYNVKYEFLTVNGAPTITTDAATSVSATSARLNSTLVSDGGGACRVRWGYDKVGSRATVADYDTVTDWTDYSYYTGNHPYYDAAGLDIDDTYYFMVEAENAYGTDIGDEQTFDTLDTVGDPSDLRAYPSATSVSLSWVKGDGATESIVRRKTGSYPATYTDGQPVYLGTSASCNDTGLDRGQTYYYSVWAVSGTYYSVGSSDVMTTTLASGVGGESLETPGEPSRWMAAPDYTNLSGLPVVYDAVNDVADSMEMPRETMWMLLAIALAAGAGILFYGVSGKKAFVGLIVMVIALAFGWTVKIVPFWIPLLSGIIVVAVLWTQRREAA